jgi:hypothetical protein
MNAQCLSEIAHSQPGIAQNGRASGDVECLILRISGLVADQATSPSLAPNRRSAMSAIWSKAEVTRTSREDRP